MIANLNKKQFAAGFGIGFLVALIFAGIFVKTVIKRHRDPEGQKVRMVEKIKKGLKLDPDQTVKVQTIVDTRFGEMKTIHESVRKDHDRIHKGARSEIREILNEEQIKKFDAFTKKMDARRARWKKRNHK